MNVENIDRLIDMLNNDVKDEQYSQKSFSNGSKNCGCIIVHAYENGLISQCSAHSFADFIGILYKDKGIDILMYIYGMPNEIKSVARENNWDSLFGNIKSERLMTIKRLEFVKFLHHHLSSS